MPHRVLSGLQPTGRPTLGNYLGAIRRWVEQQHDVIGLFPVVDLHALTVEQSPEELRSRAYEVAALLLAAGLDPKVSIVFRQSAVPAHAELTWLMESTARFGEMRRMVQFKEKAAGRDSVRLSLLSYPALMAADILLYDIAEVPVGDDQRQHVELARRLAQRFNASYGNVFVVPRAATPQVGARIMDLADPARKMGKSNSASPGNVYVLDPPDVVRRKVMRAVTDSASGVSYDPAGRPGVANLLEILAACTGDAPDRLAEGYDSCGRLKADVADAVIALLEPIQQRYAELSADVVEAVLADGSERAAALAAPTMERAKHAVGLGPARRC